MAGIWARSDNNYGVIKAPANEVVRSAVDFELRINKAQQELLNPEGVNCLRFFPGPASWSGGPGRSATTPSGST